MLPGIAEIADCAGWIDRHGVTSGNAVEIHDLVGMPVADRIEQKQADACHALQAVDAVAVQCDVKGVGVALHPRDLALSGARDAPCPLSDRLCQSISHSIAAATGLGSRATRAAQPLRLDGRSADA